MKKTKRLFVILILLIISLACQTLTNFSEGSSLPNTAEPVVAVTPTEVVDNFNPPTQGWIAFTEKNNVWLVHPDESGLTQITNIPFEEKNASIHYFEWSPDGTKLAISQNYLDESGIYLYDIYTSEITTLITGVGGDFDWSKDGQEIIYSQPSSDPTGTWANDGLWAVNLKSGNTRQIASPLGEKSGSVNPQWLSDENYVIFQIPSLDTMDYVVTDLSNMQSTRFRGFGGNCEWAPDRLMIFCSKYVPGNTPGQRKAGVVLLDIQGNILEEIPLPENMGYPGAYLSPDGKKAAISYFGDMKVWTDILSLDTKEVAKLASGHHSGWSPDGRWVLTWISESGVPNKVLMTNIISGKSFQVAEGLFGIWQPAVDVMGADGTVQPDSDTIATPAISTDLTNTPSSDQSLCDDISIEVKDTSKGNMLQICADGKTYEIGPLEKGKYAIGPNKKFFVYCTNSGDVYASRFGTPTLDLIGDVKDFSIIVRGEAPEIEFEFFGDHPYTVQVNELILKQNKTLSIPRYITTPN
jgi:hypothetical protein